MRVHVCIPHYTREEAGPAGNPHGYGSLRAGDQFQRALALNRCLHSLLNIERLAEVVLIFTKWIDHTPANLPPLEPKISVCTDGTPTKSGVGTIPYPNRNCSFATRYSRAFTFGRRDHLIVNRAGVNLLMYMEDDLAL